MTKSIRVRLQLWYAGVLTVVVAGFAAILYYEVRSARLAELDSQLESTAAGLDSALRLFPRHELTGELPPWPPPRKSGFPKGPDFGPAPMPHDHFLAGLDLPGPPSERPKDLYFAVCAPTELRLKHPGSPRIDRPPRMFAFARIPLSTDKTANWPRSDPNNRLSWSVVRPVQCCLD